jgi:hypothetical protein
MTVYNPSGVTTDYTNRTSDLREFGRFGDAVAWTRYYVGSANRQQNVSEHLMVGTPAFEVPTAGLIDYALVGGTAPTNRNAAPGSTGWFTGDLAVAFGSTAPRVGFNFDLYTEGTGYRVQTAGGAKGAATGGLGVSGEGVFETQSLGLEVIAGTGCTGYCIGQVFGGLFGKGASHAGFTYNIFDRNQNNAVQGVAIFGRSGEAIAGLGDPDQKSPNPGDPGDAETFTGNQSLATVGDKGGLVFTDIAVAYDGQSIPVGYRTASEEVGKGDTTLFETGNSDGVVRWARWADGTPVYEERAANVSDFSAVGKDGGYHFVAGAPLANIPASGTVSYEIAGFTRPTRRDESTSTGTVTGSAAVVFGTVPKVALDLDITSGSDVFDLYTAGRLTDPTQSALRVKSGGEFFTSAPLDQNPDRGAVSVDGPASFCGTACRGDVWGFLAGDGATHMGLTYRITDALRRERVEGSVAFKQGGDGNSGAVGMQVSDLGGGISTTALGVGIFPAETATASMEPAAVSRAKMAMPDTTISLSGVPAAPPTIAVAPDWGRWTVPSDALSARTMAIDTGTDTMPIAAGSMPNPRGLLGGLVTFAEVH